MVKILIVDDEDKNLYLLQVLLTSNGYELDSAKNGAEALEIAHQSKPDVIISDILMPVMDGFSFCHACKEDDRLKNIPFIFYTATYTEPQDEALALSLGAERFIVKPTEPALFLELLKETIDKYATGVSDVQQAKLGTEEYYKDYNAALIRKLEDKVAELEEKNREVEAENEARKKAEEALKASEAKYRAISTVASDYIYSSEIEPDGRIIQNWTAGAFEEITGYTREEFISMGGWRASLHPDDRQIDEQDMKTLETNRPITSELRTISKSGETVWVRVSAQPIWDTDQNRLVGVYGAVQNITERKLAEQKLLQQTARAEALVHTAAHINSNLDLDGVLSAVCVETAHALSVPGVALRTYDPVSQTISIVADYGLPALLREKSVQIPISDYPKVLSPSSDAPVIIPNAKTESRLPNADLYQSMDLFSIVSVKIKNKDTFIGSLSIYSTGKERQFSEDEIILLDSLSNQAAQAITNAHLFASTERQLKNIESLHTIDNTIANSMDVKLTLKVVLDETIERLGVDAADILLYKPTSNTLESSVSQGFRTNAMKKVSLPIGYGFAGQIAADWKRIFIHDISLYQGLSSHSSVFAEEDFVSYCGLPLRAKGHLIGVLEVFNRDHLNPDSDWFNFLETLAGQAAIAVDSIKSFEDLQISNTRLILAYDATIEGWSRAMDLRDEETEGHTRRVTQMTIQLAKHLGISDDQIVHIRRGALLHDMGKLGIPDRILLKPGKLTDEEWVTMRKHPQYAYDMLSSIDYLRPAMDIPYCHHEKWDGSGYPRGLKGPQIPMAARIFAVIDVWDALSSDRPYRPAWEEAKVREYIEQNSGTHFDPEIVSAFMKQISEIDLYK